MHVLHLLWHQQANLWLTDKWFFSNEQMLQEYLEKVNPKSAYYYKLQGE